MALASRVLCSGDAVLVLRGVESWKTTVMRRITAAAAAIRADVSSNSGASGCHPMGLGGI